MRINADMMFKEDDVLNVVVKELSPSNVILRVGGCVFFFCSKEQALHFFAKIVEAFKPLVRNKPDVCPISDSIWHCSHVFDEWCECARCEDWRQLAELV